MLLGALLGAGVPLDVMSTAVSAVAPEHVSLRSETVQRNGFAATRCHVRVADSTTHRTWPDVSGLLSDADLPEPVRSRALAVFERLAVAEATVHGTDPSDVHFHEVGALDAIADVVGACAGFEHLGLSQLLVSPVAVGSGRVQSAHGDLPVPPPAVAELLRGVPSLAGPSGVVGELCTPTGAALLTTLATSYGGQPAMSVDLIGVGAGGRDPVGHPNVLRLLVGEPVEVPAHGIAAEDEPVDGEPAHGVEAPLLLEANIDDLDPRLWPEVIEALLLAGASDAWLTPILMKKGRPAHTLTALVSGGRATAVRTAMFEQTSTIGLREIAIAKTALDRDIRTVRVDGQDVRVKLALHGGRVVNSQPEYDDVARAAKASGRPTKDVLADASAASRGFLSTPPSPH
jgi:uncharacterized protein (TIGR00299 family) protein